MASPVAVPPSPLAPIPPPADLVRGPQGLSWGGVPLSRVATEVGTPCYVYDLDRVVESYRALDGAFGDRRHLVCYSVKANENLAVIAALGAAGAGLEVVSGGELFKALRAGVPAGRIVFGGVGKQRAELDEALQAGILLFNVESEAELQLLSDLAGRRGVKAPVALRVNPDVDPKTHPYIATGLREHKFGIPWERALAAYRLALSLPDLDVCGLDCHIGSQIGEAGPFEDAARRLGGLARQLLELGCPLRLLDLGGGLGIRYADEEVLGAPAYVQALERGLLGPDRAHAEQLGGLSWLVEPGRALVAEAGTLLTRVLYVKRDGERTFVITDAAMSELVRPALYGAYHPIVPVSGSGEAGPPDDEALCDVVGPICESGDFLAQGRRMAVPRPGDLLAVLCAGAYGAAMSSRYNARPLCAEVVVRGGQLAVARRRESYEDLVQHEQVPALALQGAPGRSEHREPA